MLDSGPLGPTWGTDEGAGSVTGAGASGGRGAGVGLETLVMGLIVEPVHPEIDRADMRSPSVRTTTAARRAIVLM